MLSFLWTIIIGFIAGVIAKLVTPGSEYEPKGFILTTILGMVGALVATFSVRLLAGIRLARELASSVPSWVRCSSCSYGDLSNVAAVRNLFCDLPCRVFAHHRAGIAGEGVMLCTG